MKFICTETNHVFDIHNTEGLNLLRGMRLRLSRLADHKCRHEFQDFQNLFAAARQEIKTTTYFFFHWPEFHCARQFFF